jgi:glycosyltransferase involved in cell wall biosynthesis
MGIFPEANFFIPAYQLAKKYKISFYAYIHDLWLENQKEGSLMHSLGLRWEKEIYTNAKRVFCITEQQIKHYNTKYGIKAELFPHSIIEPDLEHAPKGMIALNNKVKKIVFSGTVSRLMNQEAVRTLIEAVNLLPDSYQLLFLTSWKKEDFEAVGIQVGKAQIKWCSKSELKKELSEADILVAPLSFKNCSLAEVNSVFQTKLIEYFISGRPILAFSPATAYQTKLAQTQGWAKICTEDSPKALAEMIKDVINNEQLGQQLVLNALKTAQERAATLYSEKLLDFVNSDTANVP